MAEPRAHRITPTPRPNGCDLAVEGFVSALLTDLLDLLGRDADLMDRLVGIVDGDVVKPDPFAPERELPTERLVADLVDQLPTEIRQIRPELIGLYLRLRDLLAAQGVTQPELRFDARPVELPRQQDRRAS